MFPHGPAAVRREVHEETGLTVTVDRMLWLRECIGAHHDHPVSEANTHRIEAIFLCAGWRAEIFQRARRRNLQQSRVRSVGTLVTLSGRTETFRAVLRSSEPSDMKGTPGDDTEISRVTSS
ncbi:MULTISPECIES: NUDIX hydrolase [Streptomyces]|uniref:NUDIX hydrolase n=1 Tax=Streptomyces TaxID=1883 RepID=UPI00342595D9